MVSPWLNQARSWRIVVHRKMSFDMGGMNCRSRSSQRMQPIATIRLIYCGNMMTFIIWIGSAEQEMIKHGRDEMRLRTIQPRQGAEVKASGV